jgi:hypothetical protein
MLMRAADMRKGMWMWSEMFACYNQVRVFRITRDGTVEMTIKHSPLGCMLNIVAEPAEVFEVDYD